MTELHRDIADAMSDVIAEHIKARREYTKDDLLKASFTLDEIDRYEPLAYGYALTKLQSDRSKNVA